MAIALMAVASASGGLSNHTPKKQGRHHVARATMSIPSNFTSPVHISTTFEGCRNTGSITLPIGGQFVCPDAAYTSGNLGKGWNELDLVPFRLITTAGNQSTVTTDYNIIVAGDYQLGSATGWDVIGGDGAGLTPTIASGSDASCSVSWNGQDVGPGITGGADNSLYRVMTIHQNAGTTCTFNYYMRIALGAHLYSGSSLQSYIFTDSNFIGGKSTIPLPVNQILGQSISKDMTASTSQNQPWNVTKAPTPATLNFGDVCSSSFANTKTVQVQVSWTKLAPTPSGQVRLITHVYATNPSARTITINVTDIQYSGTTQTNQVGTASTPVGGIDVPANTAGLLVLTDDNTISSTATHFNDVATGTYVDKVTNVAIPGSTTATANADVQVTSTTNGSATVTDSESITDTQNALTFAVATPSSGSFTGGYTAGTYTTGPVGWTSGTNAITSTGSITFNKTVKLDPAVATTGTLSDTANLTGSDGFTATSSASVGISSAATSTLTITKTIPNVLQGAETVTFHFHVYSGTTDVADRDVTFNAGDTLKTVQVAGLAQGSYTVKEDTATNWLPQDDQTVNITGCTAGVRFDNNFAPATAYANKITDPTGFQSGWTFTLTRPDSTTLTGTTDANGHVVWSGGGSQAPLGLEGSYTISETSQTGWTETGAADAGGTGTVTGGSGSTATCSFTVNYTADAGKTFGCNITNRSRGHVRVVKTFEGAALTGSESFTFQIRDGASAAAAGTIVESGTANAANNTINFATDLLPGHTYALCEALQANINSSLSASLTSYHPNGDAGYVCVDFSFTPASTVNDPAATFNVDNTPVPAGAQVRKVTNPTGYESGWVMTLSGPGTPSGGEQVTTTGTGYIAFTTQLQDGGSYTITETSQTGWTQVSASTECSFTVHYPADAGRTFSCTITNQSRGHVRVVKTLNGAALTGSSQQFTFELRQGDQSTTSTGALETLTTNGTNLGTLNFTTALVPGQTYAICELLVAGYGPSISGYGSYNPADNPNYWCWNFSITVAQAANNPSITFNVDNSHQTAKGLTIGYWKTHASTNCKQGHGKQGDVLGQYLGGIKLGIITFADGTSIWECQAVQTLSKNTFTGTKMASDPLFNMAAQLLAADLNVASGDTGCAAATTAINGAQALLMQYGWNGNGYTGTLSAADAALANQYATTLDQFNNNTLVC